MPESIYRFAERAPINHLGLDTDKPDDATQLALISVVSGALAAGCAVALEGGELTAVFAPREDLTVEQIMHDVGSEADGVHGAAAAL